MEHKAIAIITARGGSKRIPDKNIREFCGKPILAYSIQAALSTNIFDEVMVSTDSDNIAEIAKQYGASVPFMRSEQNANDYATTADVIQEVLTSYQCIGKQFDYACCIYPTAPFVTSQKLKDAYVLLQKKDADSVYPVVAFSFPPLRGVTIKNEFVTARWPEYMNMRSQDIEPIYHDCGQFYMLHTKAFARTNKMIMEKTIPMIMPESEVQDIDTLEDWKLAELKYRLMQGE